MASASAQVDLLTGQAQSYYFFDPDDATGLRQEQDDDWREEQLYVPGALVEQSASSPTTPPSSTDEVRLRLATGEVVRGSSMGLQRGDPQRQRSQQFDVATTHCTHCEQYREDGECERGDAELKCHAGPQRKTASPPE